MAFTEAIFLVSDFGFTFDKDAIKPRSSNLVIADTFIEYRLRSKKDCS